MTNIHKSWNKIARHYRGRYEISLADIHYGPLCPGEKRLRLLGTLSGRKVLELGCGAGQNAIVMAKAGAEVTAVDFSESQIAQASELAAKQGVTIDFRVGDITALTDLGDSGFSLVISACAIAFVRDFDRAFAEAFRVTRPGGIFVLSDMHPLQYILDEVPGGVSFNHAYPFAPIRVRWRWEFDHSAFAGGPLDVPFKHYVRSLSSYHNSLVEAGFKVERILEPKSTMQSPHKGFSREIWSEYRYIAQNLPITFIMLAHKS